MKRKIIKTDILFYIFIFILLIGCDAIIPPGDYLPSGTAIWAKSSIHGTATSKFTDLSIGSDAIYAVGTIGIGEIQLGSDVSIVGGSENNCVLAKYSQAGVPLWAKTPASDHSNSFFTSVAIGPDGVYAVGKITGQDYDFGNGVVITGNTSMEKSVLLKYDFSGNAQWVRVIDNSPALFSYSSFSKVIVTIDSIYVIGSINALLTTTFNFGNLIEIELDFGCYPILIKYNLSGLVQWVSPTVSTADNSKYTSITIGDDAIYIAGYIWNNGTIDFGDSVVISSTDDIIKPLLVKYNNSGVPQWAYTATQYVGDTQYNDICIQNDSLYAVGIVFGNGTTIIDGASLSLLNGRNNCFLVKYNLDGIAQWMRSITSGTSGSSFTGVFCSSDNVYASGSVEGYATYGFGNGIILDAFDSNNILLVKYNKNGLPLWAKSTIQPISGDGNSVLIGIAADDNCIYTVGSIGDGTCTFGHGIETGGSVVGDNLLLAAYKK